MSPCEKLKVGLRIGGGGRGCHFWDPEMVRLGVREDRYPVIGIGKG